jgi:hypothetical protein
MGRWRLCLVVGLLASAGCRERPDPNRYTPSEPAARQALEAALEAWRVGDESAIRCGDVRVVFVDRIRKPGQRLKRFTILGEAPGEAPRCFSVRLRLDEPAEEVRVRYVVLGIDPLWVERHEDFVMMLHWEHPMDGPDTKPAPAAKQPPPSTKPSPRSKP